MSSPQEAHQPKSKRDKRKELFAKQQAIMLQGYNHNSFQAKKHGDKKKARLSAQPKPQLQGHDLRSHENSNLANTQKIQNEQSLSKEQEFAHILDQMSLNSSSVNPLGKKHNKQQQLQDTPINDDSLNNSKSGFMSSILNDKPIEMRIQDASLTINLNAQSRGRPDGQQHHHYDESQRQFELNRQQFELENPYAQSQKINAADFRRSTSKSKSRKASQDGRHRPHRANKVSAFEKYEEIRFACFELQQKMSEMTTMVHNITNQLSDQTNPAMNIPNQTMTVPIAFLEQLHSITSEVSSDFGQVQNQWNTHFDDQQHTTQRQRSKTKSLRRKLRGLENQSMLYMRDQREFEQSLQHITKAHDDSQNQMGQYLDQIESQVSQLKDTRDGISCRYEGQLDQAVKEMVNFYENLETADPNDVDSDNMSIEQVFFIKPTHQTSQAIQSKRGKSQLKLPHQILSSGSQEGGRAHSSQNRQAPNIPRLPMDRLMEQKSTPEPPKIIKVKQTSHQAEQARQDGGTGSSRQYHQVSQRSSAQNASQAAKDKPNTPVLPDRAERNGGCPSGRPSGRASGRPSARQGSRRKELDQQERRTEGSNQYQKTMPSDKEKQDTQKLIEAEAKELEENYENGVDYVMNPVMVGAMHQTSAFDAKYEDDFEGANITMDMATERLKQFPDDYEAINSIECPDQRILMKQVLFMKYEKLLKKQAKQDRKRKKKLRKQQAEAAGIQEQNGKKGQASLMGPLSGEKTRPFVPTPTNASSKGHFGKFWNHCSSRGSLKNQPLSSSSSIGLRNQRPQEEKGLGMNERPADDNTFTVTSRFSLQSELPSIDTIDVWSAQQKFHAQDVNRTALIDCEEDLVHGLKTATQTSLVKQYEEAFRQKDIMRGQHKNEEKKLNYSSTNHSKISLIGKQMSQGSKQQQDFANKNYASNNTNSGQPIYIADSEDLSMNSDLRDQNRVSGKNLQINHAGINLDLSGIPPQQYSVKSRKSTQPQHLNNMSNVDQSIIVSQGPQSHEKMENDQQKLQSEQYQSEARNNERSEDQHVDDSMVSGTDRYQRYLDCQEGSPSLQIKNSYVQSDQSPSQLQINDTVPDGHYDQVEGEDEDQQEAVYLGQQARMDDQYRQRLPLDVIHERQSEFSQSMITNAQRINTNRSRGSRQSKNNGASHYSNLNAGTSFHKQQCGTSALPSVRSEINNQSSANRKNSSRGITQESINTDTTKLEKQSERRMAEIEDYRSLLVRSNSQAQTHRGVDNSLNQSNNINYQNSSINEQQVCIDGSRIQSRNMHKKNANSSTEVQESSHKQLQRQPSAGKIDNQNRQKYFQNFEQDLSNILMPSFNVKQQATGTENAHRKGQASKGSAILQGQVPPLGKSKSGVSDKKESRNTEMYNSRSSKNTNGYISTNQNQQPISEKQIHNYQPHSFRSQHIQGGGESLRDRSYFDESPACFAAFDQNTGHDGVEASQRNEVKETIGGSLCSQGVENSIQTHVQSLESAQAYRTDEDDVINLSQQNRFGSSIHTNIMHMQSIPSFPHSLSHSSSRDRQSKQSRAQQKHHASSNCSKPQSNLAETLTQKELHLEKTFENEEQLLQDVESKDQQIEHEHDDRPRKPFMMIRSNSECQLRDKEFYEMCDEEDEIAMYCKLAEQNIFDAIHAKNLSQSNMKGNGNTQRTESPAQIFPTNMNISNANKSSSITNNQLVFMSQQTFKKMIGKYMQTQEKTQMGHQIGQIGTATSGIVDQNSSQQQTRGKGTFKRFLNDPSRLLMSINGNVPGNPHATNLLTTSLDDGTLSNNIMMPTHQYNRRTLLMMQNLHNNYLFSNHSGILFTMQRGWNSGYSGVGDLTGINAAAGLTVDKGPSQNDGALKSLGGDPINITNLLMGANQQTSEQINAGSITIVDGDGKYMVDRKLLQEAANSASQQTNARKLFSQSRNINGQVTTSDFSSLQTKQLGILRDNNTALIYANQGKTSDSGIIDPMTNERDTNTPVHHGCYGGHVSDPNKLRKDSGTEPSSDSQRQSKSSSVDEKTEKNLGKGKQFKTLNSQDNKNKIMNLLVGLKQIQQKNPNISQRSGSDLSMEKQLAGQDKLITNFKTNVIQLQMKKKSNGGHYTTINTEDLQVRDRMQGDFERNGSHFVTLNGPTKQKAIKNSASKQVKNQVVNQQQQPGQMNMSNSIQSNHFNFHEGMTSGENSTTELQLKSKSQPRAFQSQPQKSHQMQDILQQAIPGQTPSNQHKLMSNVTNLLKKEKVRILVADQSKLVPNNLTVKQFNSQFNSLNSIMSNPAIILKNQISDVRMAQPNSSSTINSRKVSVKTTRTKSSIANSDLKLLNSIQIKKGQSNQISSARNSASVTKNDNLYVMANGKVGLKKKINVTTSHQLNLNKFKSVMSMK